ncbi:MAG: hypothetical protein IJR77_06690, partial [Bacteroidales bacterium]|nr:hypothetical protein [Bacteroidales bacterium]
MSVRWRKPTKHYEKLLRGKPRRLGQNAPLSRMLKIKLKNARFLPAKTDCEGINTNPELDTNKAKHQHAKSILTLIVEDKSALQPVCTKVIITLSKGAVFFPLCLTISHVAKKRITIRLFYFKRIVFQNGIPMHYKGGFSLFRRLVF